MSGILNVGTRALQANQVALQTAGNNIANVNTPGYSRQNVVLQTVQGQFTGSGYIGKGVEIQTIERNFSAFLNRQSALAGTTAAADSARTDKLKQLQDIFAGGTSGLGAAVNDMLNAFSDVATAPTDLTARAVVLTRVDETAARLRTASQSLGDLQSSVTQELNVKIDSINNLAKSIASVNEQIARAQGNGQSPNDLLDRRDQLVRDLNQFVQTTSIAADDGTVSIFLAGSQPLVLGNNAAAVALVDDDFGVANKKLALVRNGQSTPLDENMLGGGEVSGLLRFQNTDLMEGRNLLGRFTLAVTTSMNDQHRLGLDLDGNAGGNLFSTTDFTTATSKVFTPSHVLAPSPSTNSSPYTLTLSLNDSARLVASDYAVSFTSATGGSLTRGADGSQIGFSYTAATGQFLFQTTSDAAAGPFTGTSFDGLSFSTAPATAAVAGDRFSLQPFSTSASNIKGEFSAARALAVASPVAGRMGTANTGSLALSSLRVTQPNANLTATVTLTINAAGTIDIVGAGTGNPSGVAYVSGQALSYNGWSLTLQGIPKPGDTFTVQAQPPANRNLNAGNASAMMGLRDVDMFDGAKLSDGYAALIAQVGIRTQSAMYASDVSSSIAASLETQRTAVSGVNLDEEAAKLLQYQQAYQASAKIIQISQSIFDTLIQTLR